MPGNARQPLLLWGLVLAALVVVLYWPVSRHGFIRYDDPIYVRDNPQVAGGLTSSSIRWAFTSGHASNWHPVTWVSHMLDVQLFGMRPGAHHMVNVAFHAANALLLLLVLQRMTGQLFPAFLVAALFALHPLRVESVAWIAERKDVLSMFFFLLLLLAYTKHARDAQSESPALVPGAKPGTSSYRLPYAAALVFFALGLMSKPMLVTVPFVLLLLDLWPLQRISLSSPLSFPAIKSLLLEKVLFFGLAALSSWITYIVQEKGHAVTIVLPLTSRLANAVASYCKYLVKTLWPSDLAVFYPHPDTRYPVSEQWPTQFIILAAVLLLLISLTALWRVRREPWWFTGWFWFVGTLVPVIGIVQVGGQALADRYTYLPHAGLFVAVVYGIAELTRRWPTVRLPLAALYIIFLVVCAVLTRGQVNFWRSTSSLFEHTLRVTGKNAVAHSHLGIEAGERGEYDSAIRHFKAAIEAAPATADAYFGLGYTYELQGRLLDALEQYRAALHLRPWDDWTLNRSANVLWNLGQKAEAVQQWREALRHQSSAFEPHIKLAAAFMEVNDLAQAEGHLRAALALQPRNAEAIGRYAELHLRAQRLPEAEKWFRRLVELYPDNADFLINLGGVLWMRGAREEAYGVYQRAVAAKPDYPVAHFNLGVALLAQNRFADAEKSFRRATELQPDYADAWARLSRALAGQGRTAEAAEAEAKANTLRAIQSSPTQP